MRAEAVIRAKHEEKAEQLKSRRKEKEEILTANKSNLESEEEFRRVKNLKSINIKTRKVKYVVCFFKWSEQFLARLMIIFFFFYLHR